MTESDALLRVEGLRKYFPITRGVFRRIVGHVKAVDHLDFSVTAGECVGIVGESGCGKTTTGRCIARLIEPTAGAVYYNLDGHTADLAKLDRRELQPIRRHIQTIFQDPYSSLDPRMTIQDIVAEPAKVQRIGTHSERTERVADLLSRVGLRPSYMSRYPHEFSGGQRQRIGIARALMLKPRLIICDEPVSALDVSVQAQVLNLLSDLQAELDLTYLFIAHDLSVVEHISKRIIVMYLGKIVEMGSKKEIFNTPRHPYTEALLAAIPVADPRADNQRRPLEGVVPNPANPPTGCNFHTRCPYAQEICTRVEPELKAVAPDSSHLAACHLVDSLSLTGFQERKQKAISGERR